MKAKEPEKNKSYKDSADIIDKKKRIGHESKCPPLSLLGRSENVRNYFYFHVV